jgi:hypothetical protein
MEKVRTSKKKKETMTSKKEKRGKRRKRVCLKKGKQGMPLHQKETNKIPFKP